MQLKTALIHTWYSLHTIYTYYIYILQYSKYYMKHDSSINFTEYQEWASKSNTMIWHPIEFELNPDIQE